MFCYLKGYPQPICLDLWMLYLLSFLYTLDFSAPNAHTQRWLGHGGFTCSHHPTPESTSSFLLSCLWLTVAHLAGAFDGRFSAEVLASVALLFLPNLPLMALSSYPNCGVTCLSVTMILHGVARHRSDICESQGLRRPNRTP